MLKLFLWLSFNLIGYNLKKLKDKYFYFKVDFKITLRAYGPNVGRQLRIKLGDQIKELVPTSSHDEEYSFSFDITTNASALHIENICVDSIEGVAD